MVGDRAFSSSSFCPARLGLKTPGSFPRVSFPKHPIVTTRGDGPWENAESTSSCGGFWSGPHLQGFDLQSAGLLFGRWNLSGLDGPPFSAEGGFYFSAQSGRNSAPLLGARAGGPTHAHYARARGRALDRARSYRVGARVRPFLLEPRARGRGGGDEKRQAYIGALYRGRTLPQPKTARVRKLSPKKAVSDEKRHSQGGCAALTVRARTRGT